jgi:hypothetical protein
MRLKCRILDSVPKFMRSWIFIKRFYWQKEEIEEAIKKSKELYKLFKK